MSASERINDNTLFDTDLAADDAEWSPGDEFDTSFDNLAEHALDQDFERTFEEQFEQSFDDQALAETSVAASTHLDSTHDAPANNDPTYGERTGSLTIEPADGVATTETAAFETEGFDTAMGTAIDEVSVFGTAETAPSVAPTRRQFGEPRPTNILDPGFDLTLRPMRYPKFYDMYRDAIKNTWTVDEIDFSEDLVDLDRKLLPAERHLVSRLVAFFATGDSIVANNLVLNLYQHINAPEARMYLSRQLYEEALHVQFYLTLLDNYIPDIGEREAAFAAIENIPSIRAKAEFCFKWLDSISSLRRIETLEDRKKFLMNLICFAATIEGLFFFAAFAYVYFLRSKGLLNGLADGTNWVFRDESAHMNFAFEVVNTARAEQPELFDAQMEADVREMLHEAIECEHLFAADVLGEGVPGMSLADTRTYLEYVADQRLVQLGYEPEYRVKNPFSFMELQDVQGLSNFFERTVSSYQVGVSGDVAFNEEF